MSRARRCVPPLPEVRLRIRRLSIDAGVPGVHAIDAATVESAIHAALVARLTGGTSHNEITLPPASLSGTVADAVAERVSQSVGHLGDRRG